MSVDAGIVAQLRALADSDTEVCGALIGDASGVREAWPLSNRSVHSHHRYFIPAADVLRVERACEARGLEVIGFYHSHPGGSAVPSSTDLEEAVPGYTYLIVAKSGDLRAWRLRADRSGFDEVQV